MSKFAFLLGRKNLISLAELQSILPDQTEFLEMNGEILVVDIPSAAAEELKQHARTFLNQLGGTIKIIEISQEADKNVGRLPKLLAEMALSEFKEQTGKIRYALYIKNIKGDSFEILKKSLIETKKILKKAEISSRFINNNFQNAEIAALKGENILNKGGEICALEGKNGWYIGKTLAIQDIDAYSARDYERPERDARVGMIPPKLAQILINLTGHNKLGESNQEKTLFDPFSGMGTVLMEGLLMNFQVIGSDVSLDILNKAQKNLDWLALKTSTVNKARLFVKDAAYLSRKDLPDNISAIVSETYLGPPMSHTPDQGQMKDIFTEIEYTLSEFFHNLRDYVKPDCRIVMTLLTYRNNQGFGSAYMTMDNLINQMPKLGFSQENLISPELIKKFNLPAENQKTLLYERPDQIVCRGIYKFKPL